MNHDGIVSYDSHNIAQLSKEHYCKMTCHESPVQNKRYLLREIGRSVAKKLKTEDPDNSETTNTHYQYQYDTPLMTNGHLTEQFSLTNKTSGNTCMHVYFIHLNI